MTLFTAAVDERVRAAVVSGYLSSWAAAHRMPYNMCGSQVMWGQLGELEHVDIGALIAPRALLAETGTEDLIFPVEAARATIASLRNVYEAFDRAHGWSTTCSKARTRGTVRVPTTSLPSISERHASAA